MTAELAEIHEKLKSMVADPEAKVRRVVQTGWDDEVAEVHLIGSPLS